MIRVYDFDEAEANDLIDATLVILEYIVIALLRYQYSTILRFFEVNML